MMSIHFLEMVIGKNIPVDGGFIKDIIDDYTHKSEFKIKGCTDHTLKIVLL